MNSLTPEGIHKMAQRFVDSVDHVAYTLDGTTGTVQPFRLVAEGPLIKVYAYFNDTIEGQISNVQLVDTDGDVIAKADRTITKPSDKGFYILFRYNIEEMEGEINAPL